MKGPFQWQQWTSGLAVIASGSPTLWFGEAYNVLVMDAD